MKNVPRTSLLDLLHDLNPLQSHNVSHSLSFSNSILHQYILAKMTDHHQHQQQQQHHLLQQTENLSPSGRKESNCVRCRNHGLRITLKGHKTYCPYAACNCDKCRFTAEQQRQMRLQNAIRRAEGHDKTSPVLQQQPGRKRKSSSIHETSNSSTVLAQQTTSSSHHHQQQHQQHPPPPSQQIVMTTVAAHCNNSTSSAAAASSSSSAGKVVISSVYGRNEIRP